MWCVAESPVNISMVGNLSRWMAHVATSHYILYIATYVCVLCDIRLVWELREVVLRLVCRGDGRGCGTYCLNISINKM